MNHDAHPPLIFTKTTESGTFVRVVPPTTMPQWNTWPEKTHVLCWNCCHQFSCRPVPFPIEYDDRRDAFKVMGVFCSWACVKAYSRDFMHSMYGRGSHAMNIALLRKRLYGKSSTLSAAPPRAALKAFGGHMEIDEYRKASDECIWSTAPPRLITYSQVVHERKICEQTSRSMTNTIDLSSQIDFGSSTAAAPVETLKLKRPKPVKKANTMLEVALGLVPH